jgi:FAD-dependent urate hydroxylase
MKHNLSHQVAIIGAGPYGLATAAHLRATKIETCVFGQPMEFWENQMPEGMFLRSSWDACHIADPDRTSTLNNYSALQNISIPRPVPLDRFIEYGLWFQKRLVPDVDRRRVVNIEITNRGFRLDLHDGDSVQVQRVIVATGISLFARCPSQFSGLPSALVSHTSEHRNLKRFGSQRMAIIGSGQSALETAALLHELGAEVEVVARRPKVNWLDQKLRWLKSEANPLRPLLYPPTDVGPPGLNLIVARPTLFKRFPRSLQEKIAYRSIRPAGSGWLVPRLRGVRMTTGVAVASIKANGEGLNLQLSDGTRRTLDHVMLATGYQVNISRYQFLSQAVLKQLRLSDGYPELNAGFESSVPGLHFVGAPAAHSFGPLCRFVSGTPFTARSVTRWLLARNGLHRNGS